jgi:hypothetical protein
MKNRIRTAWLDFGAAAVSLAAVVSVVPAQAAPAESACSGSTPAARWIVERYFDLLMGRLSA